MIKIERGKPFGLPSGFFMTKTKGGDIMIEIKNKGNKVFRLAYANVIVRKLWIKGLISEEELDKLIEKNESCFI